MVKIQISNTVYKNYDKRGNGNRDRSQYPCRVWVLNTD